MPTQDEFEATISRTKDDLERIGDRVVGEHAAPAAAEPGTRVIPCRHGELTFLVVAEPDREFFELVYPLNLVASLADQVQNEPELRRYFDADGDGVDSQETAVEVAKELLDSMPPDEKHQLVFHLIERLSSPMTSFRTEGTGTGGLAGFECKKKIFPYEETFSLAHLNDAVQSVISVGHRATQFLYNTLIFDVTEAKEKPPVQLRFRLPGGPTPTDPPAIPRLQPADK